MRALILIGVSGVGKSTYVQSLSAVSDKTMHVYNADTYRIKMFGHLRNENDYYEDDKKVDPNKKVFARLNKDLDFALANRKALDIFILDNMNLSRKRRRAVYNKFNQLGIPVEAVVFFASEKTINEHQNMRAINNPEAFVNPATIHRMFTTLQVPRLHVDCDTISCVGERWFDEFNPKSIKNLETLLTYVNDANMKEVLSNNFAPHNCQPFHFESINEHIDLAIQNGHQENAILHEEAMFHDLGKSICKKFDDYSKHYIMHSAYIGHVIDKDELESLHAHYMHHADVSAQLYLNYMYSNNQFSNRNWQTLEAIYQHMNAHQGMGSKNIRNNKLDDDLLRQIEEFRKIDDVSRVH